MANDRTSWGGGLLTLAALFVFAPAVHAQVAKSATCIVGTAAARPCTLSFSAARGGTTTLVARVRNGPTLRFTGRRSDGWWSGTLDGARAMGRELNRGHVLFATADLRRTFEYWTPGNENGTY